MFQPFLVAKKAKKDLKEHFHFNTDLYYLKTTTRHDTEMNKIFALLYAPDQF